MPRMMLQNLGTQVRKKRGHRVLRETAQEIGASAPALCRIESGKLPNIQTFARPCRWLEADPAEVLNVARRTTGTTARAAPEGPAEIQPRNRLGRKPSRPRRP